MNPEQQRALDEAIIDGRLVDAIGLYRAATGCTAAEAQAYVTGRNAEVTGQSPASPRHGTRLRASPYASVLSQERPVAAPSQPVAFDMKPILIIVGVIVVTSVVVPLALAGAATAFALRLSFPNGFTHGLASFATITNEPYYPDVVHAIERDPKFGAALGVPIVVDDANVGCHYIHDDSVQKKANCDMPVHGSKASGTVRVQIVDQANSLDLGAWLSVGGRTIPINS